MEVVARSKQAVTANSSISIFVHCCTIAKATNGTVKRANAYLEDEEVEDDEAREESEMTVPLSIRCRGKYVTLLCHPSHVPQH